MVTNYKMNQPFTSNFSAEEGEEIPVAFEIMEPAELSTMLKPFYAEARKVSGRKTIQSQHCESQFVPGWTELFSGSLQRKPFPLFGISIQAGKRSSRSITERSCATGIDFFQKVQASNFKRRPWSPPFSKSAWSEFSRRPCKFVRAGSK